MFMKLVLTPHTRNIETMRFKPLNFELNFETVTRTDSY